MSLGPDEHGRNTADSAGLPWAGRSFAENTAAADDGSADPALLAALTAFAAEAGRPEGVVEAFRRARLLIPLVAHAGDVGHTADGHLVDKTQELSIVTVAGPDGRKVLPAFTSVETLARWNPQARPVPAAGPRIALAAASEQTELIVIDPASPTEFVLRRPAVFALSTDQHWAPPHRAPVVIAAFDASIAGEADALAVRLENGDPRHRLQAPELVVAVAVRQGLDQPGVKALVTRLSERWAASPEIANGVDSMTLRLIAA